jgi:hypothetical protein
MSLADGNEICCVSRKAPSEPAKQRLLGGRLVSSQPDGLFE